jgi:uncharacterized protein (DUF1810 family)
MNTSENLKRFIDAQENTYPDALMEIKNGKKKSHWMWYIFPQIYGLGSTEISKFYAIKDLREAQLYLQHPILGQRLIDISKALSEIKDKSAHEIFGSPDDLKLKSCMTLFSSLKNAHPIFQQIIDQFFDGKMDNKTLEIIS